MTTQIQQDVLKEAYQLLDDALTKFQQIDSNPIADLVAGMLQMIIKHYEG